MDTIALWLVCGAGAKWADFSAVMNQIGTTAPRNYMTTYYTGLEQTWGLAKTRGAPAVYNQATARRIMSRSDSAYNCVDGWVVLRAGCR